MTTSSAATASARPMRRDCDIAVVGGGPAGLAAAVWSARFRRRVVVIDSGEVRNRWTAATHGYLTAEDSSPSELLRRARDDLAKYPQIEVIQGSATRIALLAPEHFEITLDGGPMVTSRRVILATGVKDRLPSIERFFDFYGSSVFTCPSCDGYEASGRDIVVWGSDTDVIEFAFGMLDWAASITIVGHEDDLGSAAVSDAAGSRVRFVNGHPVRFCGTAPDLQGVELEDGSVVPCAAFFFTVQHDHQAPFAEQLGCHVSDEGCITVDEHGETSVPGVYAAGDITPGMHLVQLAAAKGATAGVAAAMSLRAPARRVVTRSEPS